MSNHTSHPPSRSYLPDENMAKDYAELQVEHINLIWQKGALEKQLEAITKERDELLRWKNAKQQLYLAIRSPQGFSLVELLTVIAILAIMSCCLLPAVCKTIHHARAKAQQIQEFESTRLEMALDGNFTNQLLSVAVETPIQAQP